MKKILFKFFIAFNSLLRRLPYGVIFVISDFFYFIIYYIIGYRKRVVRRNLRNAFPTKSGFELKRIEKKFFHHLCDTILETIIQYKVSKNKMKRICTYKNLDLLEKLYKEGKSIIGVVGHYGNWEYLIGLQLSTKYQVLGLYKPLHNEYFDKFVYSIRSQFGMVPVPVKTTLKALLNYKSNNVLTLMIVVGDQTPSKNEIQYWTPFLNQETPVYLGIEKIARKLNNAVVYIYIKKVKRGHYDVEFIELFHDAEKTTDYEISESHIRILEKKIQEKPEYWLWSHKRWKHDRKDFK